MEGRTIGQRAFLDNSSEEPAPKPQESRLEERKFKWGYLNLSSGLDRYEADWAAELIEGNRSLGYYALFTYNALARIGIIGGSLVGAAWGLSKLL